MRRVTKGSSQDGGTQDARIPARSTEGSPFYDMAYASNKAKERTGWTASQEAMDVPVELPQSALSNVKQMRVYSDSGSSSFSALGTRLESSSGIGPRRPRPSADVRPAFPQYLYPSCFKLALSPACLSSAVQ